MKRVVWVVLLLACHSREEMHGESKRNVVPANADTTPATTSTPTDVPALDMPAMSATAAPVISGRVPPEVVGRIIRSNMRPLKGCYERALAKNPSLSGKVSMRFSFDSKGNVTSAAADPARTTLSDASVTS